MSELTRRAEETIAHIIKMREHAKEVMCYCTKECGNCPIRGFCDWDGNFDYLDEGMESIERIADFIDMSDRYDEKAEAKKFKEATGYSPREWDAMTREVN